jgi:uncharacterized protein YyaL (SSP411 family)
MIAALAQGHRVLGEDRYLRAAGSAAEFILIRLRDSNGHLLHRYRDGEAGVPATANDYAFFIMGLISLYQASGETRWIEHARTLQQLMNSLFWDTIHQGFYLTADYHSELPVRPKEIYDGALPSANAVALSNLLHIGRLLKEEGWVQQAGELLRAFAGSVQRQPMGYTHMLSGWVLAHDGGV